MNTQDTPISTSKPPPCAPSGTQTCAAEKDTEPSIVAVEEDAESLLLGWDAVEGAVFYELQMLKQAVKSIGYVTALSLGKMGVSRVVSPIYVEGLRLILDSLGMTEAKRIVRPKTGMLPGPWKSLDLRIMVTLWENGARFPHPVSLCPLSHPLSLLSSLPSRLLSCGSFSSLFLPINFTPALFPAPFHGCLTSFPKTETPRRTVKSNMVRKRNLSHSTPYRFRVRVRDKVDWLPFQTSSLLHTLSTFVQRMAAPRGEVGGAAGCVTLSWEPVEEAAAYAVHMREQGAVRWKEVGRVGGTSVKKKNLEAGKAYHFRVRPVGERVEDVWVWSPWSEAMSPPSLPPVLRRMFGSRLAVEGGKEGKREIGVESLAGSVVGVYASAHWCAPCRQFTPQLANFYRGLQGAGKAFEIVFVSLDQEKEAFELYFESMPWLAIPWEGGEGEREALMRMYQITSVPRLLIFGRDGELLENNAVGSQFLREEAFHSWWEGRPFRAGGGGCCGGGGCK